MIAQPLEPELREALNHLYDPAYQPSAALCAFLGCDPADGVLSIQSAIMRGIAELEPAPDTPGDSPARRIHDLLHNRFVLKLTLQETADRLNLSFSSVCRTQRTAIHSLTRLLWERQQAIDDLARAATNDPASSSAGAAGAWRAQTQRELAALQASAPGAISNVDEAIQGTINLLQPMLSELNVRAKAVFVQPELTAMVHRSALRQVLITAIRRMANHTGAGELEIYAGLQDGDTRITITGVPTSDRRPDPSDLTADLVTSADLVVEADVEGELIALTLEWPSAGKMNVLVVDDNHDIAGFYRRASEGTRYNIIHIAQGRGLFDVVRSIAPDIIVLDVMLPDIDGWDLLMQLQANATTRTIPVIVSSVVKEQELALSLGATTYLPKPVRPRELIRVLDQCLPPG